MIRFTTGNIITADAEALVNTINCVGVMGRGIALQFKKAFPDNFRAYREACARGEVNPGRMFVFDTGTLANPRCIINFPTKRHWHGNSRIEDINAGLKDLIKVIRERGIRSIAIPPLGCGLGGLAWDDVRPRIEKAFRSLDDLQVVVFKPRGAPAAKDMAKSKDVPKMSASRAALIGLMDQYLRGLLDPFITLLEVHKLMYFMQVAGQPLKLKFTKGPYGPYAENLRHVLNSLEGHFISGYGDGGDMPGKRLELVPGALEDSNKSLKRSPRTRERFDRVADLVTGFESAFGLELLATVHWVLAHDRPASQEALVQQTYAWNNRKRRFSPRQIRLAADILIGKGWVDFCDSQTVLSNRTTAN